jgi:hypothetical protein
VLRDSSRQHRRGGTQHLAHLLLLVFGEKKPRTRQSLAQPRAERVANLAERLGKK